MITYAKLSQLRPGDRLIADDGFTCIKRHTVLTVEADAHYCGSGRLNGHLFVKCDDGKHFLAVQTGMTKAEDGDTVVGLVRA